MLWFGYSSLFDNLCTLYIFNILYQTRVKEFFRFIQEVIMEIIDICWIIIITFIDNVNCIEWVCVNS